MLLARVSAAPAQEPLILPPVTEILPAPYDAVWDAALRSLNTEQPVLGEEKQEEAGFVESDPFFFYFPLDTGATQGILVDLAITLRRVDPQHTAVQVQPRVLFMVYDGALPGPIRNPWTDFLARLRSHLGQAP